jgi:hypothetical protein
MGSRDNHRQRGMLRKGLKKTIGIANGNACPWHIQAKYNFILTLSMLQNRVDPLGHLIRTSARGAWMGNRGLLHNEHREIVRPFRLKAWLICVLEFKGRHRTVMTPRRYTELFFLDEATAFAAGHRPCFECRREAAQYFRQCWVRGNPTYSFTETTSIEEIDAVLHGERLAPEGSFTARIGELPDGVFVLYEDKPHLVAGGSLLPWSPFGYGEAVTLSPGIVLPVLTPGSTVNAFRMGYVPQIGI